MNSSLRWKLIAAFLLVFIAGLACGFFTSPFVLAHRMQHGLMAEHMLDRLSFQLRLTPEQREQIKPIVNRTATQLQEARRDMAGRVREVLRENRSAVMPLLNPEQRDRLREMEEAHRRFGRDHSPIP